MKVTDVKDYTDDESTQTLEIIKGETSEGSRVTEKLSIDKKSGETVSHITLETPSTDDIVYRSLEELAAETAEKLVEIPVLDVEVDEDLLDELEFKCAADDELEKSLLGEE